MCLCLCVCLCVFGSIMCVRVFVCVFALKQSVLCWNLLFVVIVITIISHVWMYVFVTGYMCVFEYTEYRHTIVILMFVLVRVYQRVHLCENINAVLMRL